MTSERFRNITMLNMGKVNFNYIKYGTCSKRLNLVNEINESSFEKNNLIGGSTFRLRSELNRFDFKNKNIFYLYYF